MASISPDVMSSSVREAFVSLTFTEYKIWGSDRKGVLFRLFKEFGYENRHVEEFFKIVRSEIAIRRQGLTSINGVEGLSVSGRILAFGPNSTTYDGCAETQSSGFFDSDDVPPPELWIGVCDGQLYSFVPHMFLPRASEGVDSSLGESLEWKTDIIDFDI